jgi:hypothetical protein
MIARTKCVVAYPHDRMMYKSLSSICKILKSQFPSEYMIYNGSQYENTCYLGKDNDDQQMRHS